MRYDFYNQTGNQAQPVETTEERMTKNERARVTSMIRSYTRNPQRWSPKMVLKLQQMADSYDIAWSPQKPDPGFLKKAGAMLGGVVDTAAFDLIPDKWYSGPGTEKAAMLGKVLGIPISIAAAILTGGGTAAAAGGLGGLAKGGAMAGKSLAGSNLAARAAGFIPGVALGGRAAGMAQTTVAPLLSKAGMGGKWVKGGVAAAGRQNKRKALDELMTLRGGVDNARAVEILKTGGFSPKEIEVLARRVIGSPNWSRTPASTVTKMVRPGQATNPIGGRMIPPQPVTTVIPSAIKGTPNKAMVKAMVDAALPGAVSGGKLNSNIITALATNVKGMTKIGQKNLSSIKTWIKRSVPDAPQSVIDDLAKEIIETGAKNPSDLFRMGATMAGEGAAAAVATSPQWGQVAQAAGLIGASAMPAMAGMDPAIDPLRPYYAATTGQ